MRAPNSPSAKTRTRARRRSAAPLVPVVLLAASAAATSCILADPPAELDPAPASRLRIVRESSTPPVGEILRTWPGTFHILVDTAGNPDVRGQAFLDYDPSDTTKRQGFPLPNLVAVDDAGLRIVDVSFDAPDPTRCHTVEVILATANFDTVHRPPPDTGDSIVWFYSPSGDVSSCGSFDGGLVFTDAATDAPAKGD